MAITIDNLRIVPYQQKDTYKPIWGDTLDFSFVLPSAHADGDKYCFGCDFERVVSPTMRPLCAYTEDYEITTTDAGQIISLTLVFNTARFRDWVSTLKKPTPITLQLVRIRDEVQDTLLLDDILALPSVVDGENIVCPGDPLEDLLAEKLDKPEEEGTPGQALVLGPDRKPIWKTGGGGVQAQADWDESDSDEPDYIRNKPTIPAPQVQADWDESDSEDVAYIQNKPDIASDVTYTDLATSTAASLTVAPGTATVWTPAGNGTLSVSGGEAGKRAYAMIDIVLGASNAITLSGGLSWMSETDALASSTKNRCVVVFDGVSATIGVC
jgi:hypothetical protein